MMCEHCQGVMIEEELVVTGGVIRIKGVSAWHCAQCGQIEYKAISADASMAPDVMRHTNRPLREAA